MIFELIELIFTLVEIGLRDVTILARLFTAFFDLLASIGSVLFVCMPEAIASIVLLSVSIIVVLKVIQFH